MLLPALTLLALPSVTAPAAPANGVLPFLEERGNNEVLLAALQMSGLVDQLAAADAVTLLAPTDRAFGRIPSREVARLFTADAEAELEALLLGHVIDGTYSATELLGLGQVETLGGELLSVELRDGRLLIGGVAVVDNDLACEGGVVHELDGLIVPAATPEGGLERVITRAFDLAAPLDDAGRSAVYELALASAAELGPDPAAARRALFTPWRGRDAASRAEELRLALVGLLPTDTPSGAPTMDDRPLPEDQLLIDFEAEGEPSWFTLNDDVMGGISRSRFEFSAPSVGRFAGALSLENNGGFATIRSQAADYDLGDRTGLRLRVRGDGREYGINVLAGDERGRVGSWRKTFTAPAGEWAVVEVPFAEMVLNIRGRRYPDVGPPDAEAIRSFSFIIADKDETPFALEIDWIAAY